MNLTTMTSLKFTGEITLDEVYSTNKSTIHNSILQAISKVYLDQEINEIQVIKISINEVEYLINLQRSKFKVAIQNLISFFEEIEEYEKCQLCLNIINELNQKKEAI